MSSNVKTKPANKPANKPTICPLTLKEFKGTAYPFDGSLLVGVVEGRKFSTGSSGYYVSTKAMVPVCDGGPLIRVQVSGNIVLLGSKEATPMTLPPMDLNKALAGKAAKPKEFSTGSFGWNLTAKIDTPAGPAQAGLNITVIGSKEAARQ